MILNFNTTIDNWIKEVQRYSFEQLCAKPSAKSWSLGQVCMHLIADTRYYIKQIIICVQTDEHADKKASPFVEDMFRKNEFPDVKLKGDPLNALVPQPASREQVITDFRSLQLELDNAIRLMMQSKCKGKTQHPGFQYLSAGQWLQLADMHLRHHLRQKERIEDFLRGD